MTSRLLPKAAIVVLAVTLAGCADVESGRTGTGNMVDAALVKIADTPETVTGELTVEAAGSGKACLLLTTSSRTSAPSETYVLRTSTSSLTAVAWQTHGTFDASLSGFSRDGQVVVPYDTGRITVRGGLVNASDPVCGKHPTWGFTSVRAAS